LPPLGFVVVFAYVLALMAFCRDLSHAVRVIVGAGSRRGPWLAASAVVGYAAAVLLQAAMTFGPARVQSGRGYAISVSALFPTVALGLLVALRAKSSVIGGLLAWVAAAPAVVSTVELWGQTLLSTNPWPGATGLFVVKQGFWVWNLAGFFGLCLLFPDGRLPGRRWRRLPVFGVLAALLLNAAVSLDPTSHKVSGVMRAGYGLALPNVVWDVVLVATTLAYLAVLLCMPIIVIRRVKGADGAARQQVRLLVIGASSVPILLACGWIADLEGVPVSVWGPAFLITMLTALPAGVAIAVLRHDLYDIDRLVGAWLAWSLTTVGSAAVFAAIVYGAGTVVGLGSGASVSTAAFIAALLLLPAHRVIQDRVGRVVDRERTVMTVHVADFVVDVRDGRAEPEAVEEVLRAVLSDPGLRLFVRLPGSDPPAYLDLVGGPAPAPDEHAIRLRNNDTEVGVIVLGHPSARRVRQARDLAVQVRLPIELSRLRLELRLALTDVRAAQSRLMIAGADERRRLERDLHDGAQQQILAVGMRLRSVQRQFPHDEPVHEEMDAAVQALESTVSELRRLAHGVRPSALEDGIRAALRSLALGSPIPVELALADVEVSEVVAATTYFVVAECLANAYKHAHASKVAVSVDRRDEMVTVEVRDDGIGGATGLTSIRDRVAALGGTLTVASPKGAGTCIRVCIPCGL
jgi:signal transduction histidine kinase